MATVSFKKGLLAGLPKTYTEGTLYITTDERAIYLDVSDSARIRIGDFQEVADLDALQAIENPSTTALYYVADLNVLAKYNGSAFVQINLDTGATSVEVIGSGNAVTAASYDAVSRKLTLTLGETFATKNQLDTLDAYIGDIPEEYEESNIVAYINKKAEETLSSATGGSSESAASVKAALDAYKAQNDPKVAALEEDSHTHSNKEELDLIASGDKAKWDAAATNNAAAAAAADAKATAAQADVDALEAKVGAVTDGKTVVQMIAEAQEAATYDDTEVKADIKANTDAIGVLNGEATVEGSVKKTVSDEIAKVIAGAPESFDTLKEVSDWIATHGQDAAQMNSAILALQAILDGIGDTESGEKSTVVAYVTDAIAALNIGDYAKAADLTALAGRVTTLEGATHTHANKALLDTYTQTETDLADAVAKKHEHSNKTVLDGITSEKVTAWDAAEQNAKDYADGLATNYDASGAATAAETAAKAYADGLAVNYDAAGSADGAEAAAKEYTDTALTWGSF